MDDSRYQKWMMPLIYVQGFDMWFYEILNGLARMDAKLVAEDHWMTSFPEGASRGDSDREKDHYTHSYLWVLGAYELIRTIWQQLNEGKHPHAKTFRKLVEDFEKVRMPLAKLESPRKFKGNLPIARVAIARPEGVCWILSNKLVVSRIELSDLLIEALNKVGEVRNIKQVRRKSIFDEVDTEQSEH
ncbi:hypothetical protein [Pseudomonas gingeri]|uniref:hypothetical protein n=1 Tax=Pseudomonas gingeri TaxID=117681 RepID=UPI0015A3883B|nr:hypothetical protein [Pseudomonas gingeri]NWA10209.1 hypothetical protein [Pseudomonas gingeri]